MVCRSITCPIMDTTGGVNCDKAISCQFYNEKPPVPGSAKTTIDHPAHYQGEHECIDLMREIYGDDAVRHFCICNAYKYRFRAGRKNGNSAQDDMAKAEWYENYVMRYLPMNQMLQSQKYIDVIMKCNARHASEDSE